MKGAFSCSNYFKSKPFHSLSIYLFFLDFSNIFCSKSAGWPTHESSQLTHVNMPLMGEGSNLGKRASEQNSLLRNINYHQKREGSYDDSYFQQDRLLSTNVTLFFSILFCLPRSALTSISELEQANRSSGNF